MHLLNIHIEIGDGIVLTCYPDRPSFLYIALTKRQKEALGRAGIRIARRSFRIVFADIDDPARYGKQAPKGREYWLRAHSDGGVDIVTRKGSRSDLDLHLPFDIVERARQADQRMRNAMRLVEQALDGEDLVHHAVRKDRPENEFMAVWLEDDLPSAPPKRVILTPRQADLYVRAVRNGLPIGSLNPDLRAHVRAHAEANDVDLPKDPASS